jgi:hypothetical protein
MFEPNFKFSTYSKRAACALFITSVMLGGPVWAQDNNNNNNNNSNSNTGTKGRTYSFADFLKYVSSFSKVPTKFTWEDDIKPEYQGTPGRPVEGDIKTEIVIKEPLAAPPLCLAASPPLADIYSGACSSTSQTIPYVTDAELTYEGTYCYGSFGSFKVTVAGGALQDVTVVPEKRIQYKIPSQDPNIAGQQEFACTSLVTYPGNQPVTIPGTLSGRVVYRCQAGVWRLIEVSCSDYVKKCEPGTVTRAYGGYTATINATTTTAQGGAGPSIPCASLGDPGPGLQWVGGPLTTFCDANIEWNLYSGSCGRAAPQPPPSTQYPSCTGPDAVMNSTVKVGLDICMSVDGLRYYWLYSPGYAPEVTQCASTAGCS